MKNEPARRSFAFGQQLQAAEPGLLGQVDGTLGQDGSLVIR